MHSHSFLTAVASLLAFSWISHRAHSFAIPESFLKTDIQNSRREVLTSSAGLLILAPIVSLFPSTAEAAYGEAPKAELPNYIEFLLEKNYVADPSSFLYQGPDPKVQLQRLLEASKRLDEIPALAEAKKWSQVQGVLTGPMGTLAQTLNAISSNSSKEVQAKAKQVKTDILNISLAASKKNQDDVINKTKAAEMSLDAFVRAAFWQKNEFTAC